jgi:hypothetical protein
VSEVEQVTLPLPCIVCGLHPEPACEEGWQPSGATAFSAGSGHYGSTVWDEMSRYRSLELNVCDVCLVKHKDRVAVAVSAPPVRTEAQFVPWDAPSDD